VLTTAIEVKEDDRDEKRAEPAIHLPVGIRHAGQRGAVIHAQPGIAAGQRAQASRHGGRVFRLHEDRAEQRTRLVACGELWREQGVAEPERPRVDRDDGGAGAGPVAEHDGHAFADSGVGGVGTAAPQGDRVPVQVRQ